ncbi:MAG: hypothetical protein AB4426_15820 [Xenococcaceae cyanobacterium]
MNLHAHRLETTLTDDGTLLLQNLPFQKGDVVEVIILKHHCSPEKENPYPLKGKVIRYDDPFEAAAPVEDWFVLQ